MRGSYLSYVRRLMVLVASLWLAGNSMAQSTPQIQQAPPPPNDKSPLTITLSTSRAVLTAGGTLGIVGTLTNTWSDTGASIYLSERSVSLMRDPELLGKATDSASLPAFFPTEPHFYRLEEGKYKAIPPDSIMLCLKPGQSAQVSWTIRSAAPKLGQLKSSGWLMRNWEWFTTRIVNPIRDHVRNEMQFIFFTPGSYKVAVVAKYWTSHEQPRYEYRVANQSIALNVAAPQLVILFGAALGGLAAFLVFPNRRTQELSRTETNTETTGIKRYTRVAFQINKSMWSAIGAMLLSSIVTILLSRLSDTQFLIKVSVADFWGAIVTGLVAQYLGSKWLERLLAVPASAPSTEPRTNSKAESKEETKPEKQLPHTSNNQPSLPAPLS